MKHCLKVDVSNYFNSIPVERLLVQLEFLKEKDCKLYDFMEQLLTADSAIVCENNLRRMIVQRNAVPWQEFLSLLFWRMCI